jgi:hypothetical protein
MVYSTTPINCAGSLVDFRPHPNSCMAEKIARALLTGLLIFFTFVAVIYGSENNRLHGFIKNPWRSDSTDL